MQTTITIPGWLGIVLTLGLAFISLVTFLNTLKFKTDKASSDNANRKEDIDNLREEFKQFSEKFTNMLFNLNNSMIEQTTLNRVSVEAMKSMLTRMDHFQDRLNANAENVSALAALLKDMKTEGVN